MSRSRTGSGGDFRTGAFAFGGIAFYLAFLILPVLAGFAYAFTNWNGITAAEFVGFDNFLEVAIDPEYRVVLRNTLVFAIVIIVGQNVLALGLAILLDGASRWMPLLRAVFFAPVMLSSAVVALIWGFVYSPLTGALPEMAGWIGLEHRLLADVLGNRSTALLGVSWTVIWQFTGYLMVIYLVGLKGVPRELHEAAAIDGASGWQAFRWITLPLLKPATSVALTISLVGNLRLFDHVWLLTGGGPAGATDTIGTEIYKTAFNDGRFGYAAAQAAVMTVIVAIIVWIQRRASAGEDLA